MLKIRLISFVILLIFSACAKKIHVATNSFDSNQEYIDFSTPDTSYIYGQIKVPISKFTTLLNQEISDTLYFDDSFDEPDKDMLKLTVKKASPVKIRSEKGMIITTMALDFFAEYKYTVFGMSQIEKVNFTSEISYATKLIIHSDWHLSSVTKTFKHEYITEPKVKFGFVTISLKTPVNMAMKPELDAFAREIDRELKPHLETAYTALIDLWPQLLTPYTVDETENIVLKHKINNVELAPLYGNDSLLFLDFGLYSNLTLAQDSLLIAEQSIAIPPVKEVANLRTQSDIRLSSSWTYTSLNTILNDLYKDYEYTHKKKKVIVKAVELYGNNNILYINLLTTGSLQGNIIMNGIPVYNPTTNVVYLEGIDYELGTKKILTKSANWLLKSTFRKQLASNARIDMPEFTTDINSYLNTLSEEYYQEAFKVIFDINNVIPKDIKTSSHGMIMRFYGQGSLKIDVKK